MSVLDKLRDGYFSEKFGVETREQQKKNAENLADEIDRLIKDTFSREGAFNMFSKENLLPPKEFNKFLDAMATLITCANGETSEVIRMADTIAPYGSLDSYVNMNFIAKDTVEKNYFEKPQFEDDSPVNLGDYFLDDNNVDVEVTGIAYTDDGAVHINPEIISSDVSMKDGEFLSPIDSQESLDDYVRDFLSEYISDDEIREVLTHEVYSVLRRQRFIDGVTDD